jgi:hypothetical protein
MSGGFMVAMLLVLAIPPAAGSPPGAEDARQELIKALRRGSGLRLTVDGRRVEIHEPALEGNRVTFAIDERGGRGQVPLDRIERIETRGSVWKRTALGGGILGTAVGVMLVTAITQDGFEVDPACGAGLLVLGAFAGAAAGAIVGAPTQIWETVYRAESQSLGLLLDPRGGTRGAGLVISRTF